MFEEDIDRERGNYIKVKVAGGGASKPAPKYVRYGIGRDLPSSAELVEMGLVPPQFAEIQAETAKALG